MANIYKNAKLDLTTTNATTLYTVPSNSRAIVKSILVNDDSGSGDSISVTLLMQLLLYLVYLKVKVLEPMPPNSC